MGSGRAAWRVDWVGGALGDAGEGAVLSVVVRDWSPRWLVSLGGRRYWAWVVPADRLVES
jgi:hypothetical protein